jgi:type IV pilus assembly protein PilQ
MVAFVMMAGILIFTASGQVLAADSATDKPRPDAAPIIITGITIEDNAVRIKVQGTINYTIYKPADPFLVTVEIEGASVGQFRDKIISKSKGITEVSPVQIEVPGLAARLDIMLQSKNEIRTEIKGDVLIVSIDRPAGEKMSADASGPSATAPREITELFTEKGEGVKPGNEPKADKSVTVNDGIAREITEMFFDKDKDIVELVIKADGKLGEPAVYQLDGTVIIEIPGVNFRAPMLSKMLPPVKDVSVKNEQGKLKIVITAQAGSQSEVYILDDELLVDFMAPGASVKKEVTEKGSPVQDRIVNGTKVISLDFQDADIVPIIRLLGDVSGYNMVVHPDVKGKITMKLLNVPWTQALDIIIKTFNLEKVVEGNIIRVATVKAFQEEKKSMAENKELFGKAEDIVTKIFTVNNANVDTVKGKDGKADMPGLKELIEKGKILSPRGTISVDIRTRSIIIKDIPSSIDAVSKLLEALDKPTRQVLIEARIVEITTSYAQSLGVEWGMTGKSKGVFARGDSATTQGSTGNSILGGQSSGSTLFNLPAALTSASPATSAITFGYLTADKTLGLDLRLSAIETRGKIRVVASPKILTLDNQEAIIKQGKKIPITTSQNSGGTVTYTTTYYDATLKLTVTPQVSPDGAVVMKLELIRDEPNYTKVDVLGNPQIDTRLASTQVILNNGETVVIGGIINNSEQKTDNVVPGISKIPLIGELFKQNDTEISNFELLIFLTPKLIL